MSQNTVANESTPVLIVGGGPSGLSAALFLAWRGIPCVLVEKHPGSSLHPRAIGFTTRTLELFRAVGLDAAIPQVPSVGRPRRVRAESLAGTWSAEVDWSSAAPDATKVGRQAASPPSPPTSYSPCTGAAIAQDRLEPIIRQRAVELGADIRLNTQLMSFAQDATGVVARLRQRDGREYDLRADYLIAADGHASPIRDALGIGRSGHGVLQVVRSVLFRASLDEYLKAGISQFELDQPGLKGMLTTYRDGRWLLMFSDDEERDEATLRATVVQAVGKPDLDFELITTGRWMLSALIADRFASERAFLVGDAAHTLPPARGGYGANTGIEDASNLAWKLASVLQGVSSPELLETYDAERRPIAWLRHNQIFARRDYAGWATAEEQAVPIIDDDAMELGQLYRSQAVVGAGEELPPARRPDQWAGQPGTRAPHLWVTVDGIQRSTIDLVPRDWRLVCESERWCQAAGLAGKQLGIELRCVRFGAGNSATSVSPPLLGTGKLTDEALARTEALLAAVHSEARPVAAEVLQDEARAAFGLGPSGASLIRPDGYVAWRTVDMPADPIATLVAIVRQVGRIASH